MDTPSLDPLDPLELARTLPGVTVIGGAPLVAAIGDPTRSGIGKAVPDPIEPPVAKKGRPSAAGH